MCFMPHYEHPNVIIILGIRVVVRALLVGWGRLSFHLSTPLFVVAEFSTIPAFDWAVLVARSGTFTKLPLCVLGLLPIVGIVFSGRVTLLASVESSSIIRLRVEHLTYQVHCSFVEHDFLRPIVSPTGQKLEGGFSLTRMANLIEPNRGAKPLRHICTISSRRWWHWSIQVRHIVPWSSRYSRWSTYISLLHIVQLMLELKLACGRAGCKNLLEMPQASFGVFYSRI